MKQRLVSFFRIQLEHLLWIAAQVVFILIPTLYLCSKVSWAYALVPGIPIIILGFYLWSALKKPSATGDAQGAVIIYFIVIADVLIMVAVTAMALYRFCFG